MRLRRHDPQGPRPWAAIAGVIVLAGAVGWLGTSCKRNQATSTEPDRVHQTMPPPLWVIARSGGLACTWEELHFGSLGSKVLVKFPMRCDEADLAWSGKRAILWLRADRLKLMKALEKAAQPSDKLRVERLYSVKLGHPPVELPIPRGGAILNVGFDDVPLLFMTPSRSNTDDIRVWALVDNRWVQRAHERKPLPRLAAWRNQRGHSARKQRQLGGTKPLTAAEVTQLPDVPRTLARRASQISDAIRKQGFTRDGVVVVTPSPTSWWGFDAGGVRMAIRGKHDRLLPDLRCLVKGQWETLYAPLHVSAIRREIWPAGVEVRGTWVLVTSDGRGGELVNAKINRRLCCTTDTALALFAP